MQMITYMQAGVLYKLGGVGRKWNNTSRDEEYKGVEDNPKDNIWESQRSFLLTSDTIHALPTSDQTTLGGYAHTPPPPLHPTLASSYLLTILPQNWSIKTNFNMQAVPLPNLTCGTNYSF